MPYDLVIFDCDGTLVDSERLYNTITAELLNGLGYAEYTPELCLELFAGYSWSTIRQELEIRHQEKMPDDIIGRYVQLAEKRMYTDVQAVPDALGVVEQLGREYKLCVASNGERHNVLQSLELTGLIRCFAEEHVFTKIQVARPKPAPDLFLFACAQMSVSPDRAVVIEDSLTGVRAARSAHIDVIGFVGTAHDSGRQAEILRDAGAFRVLERLIHIPEAIADQKRVYPVPLL